MGRVAILAATPGILPGVIAGFFPNKEIVRQVGGLFVSSKMLETAGGTPTLPGAGDARLTGNG